MKQQQHTTIKKNCAFVFNFITKHTLIMAINNPIKHLGPCACARLLTPILWLMHMQGEEIRNPFLPIRHVEQFRKLSQVLYSNSIPSFVICSMQRITFETVSRQLGTSKTESEREREQGNKHIRQCLRNVSLAWLCRKIFGRDNCISLAVQATNRTNK